MCIGSELQSNGFINDRLFNLTQDGLSLSLSLSLSLMIQDYINRSCAYDVLYSDTPKPFFTFLVHDVVLLHLSLLLYHTDKESLREETECKQNVNEALLNTNGLTDCLPSYVLLCILLLNRTTSMTVCHQLCLPNGASQKDPWLLYYIILYYLFYYHCGLDCRICWITGFVDSLHRKNSGEQAIFVSLSQNNHCAIASWSGLHSLLSLLKTLLLPLLSRIYIFIYNIGHQHE
ncbi:hypothetical protein ADUPG1_011428 [Aduncisulcus paluster]|uniref:Maturase K n=1 Tax=Aduncisulcus paluster TaxID=2918883 RepID=A0ABQ5JYZ9_9EUKA|nr:hypothetical protein ADUPG1_011428 [Aduncisulcus paluster]